MSRYNKTNKKAGEASEGPHRLAKLDSFSVRHAFYVRCLFIVPPEKFDSSKKREVEMNGKGSQRGIPFNGYSAGG